MSEKEFEVIKLMPKESIGVSPKTFAGQLKPVRLYVLPRGSEEEKPSYAWEFHDAFGGVWIAQISHKMLSDGLKVANIL